MIGNAFLDVMIGKIPVLGTIFDFTYKANDRNVKLLKEHYFEDKHQGSAWKYIMVYLLIALALMLVFIAATVWIAKLVWGWIESIL